MTFVLKLSTPIKLTGKSGIEERREIKFRDPRGDELFDLGEPFVVERTITGNDPSRRQVTVRVTRHMGVIKDYLCRLSDLMAAELGQMSARDTLKAADWLCDVAFGGETETESLPPQSA